MMEAGATLPQFPVRRRGIGGYGFLPYTYVTQGLARDFWTVLISEWISSIDAA